MIHSSELELLDDCIELTQSSNCKSRLWICQLDNYLRGVSNPFLTWYLTSNKCRLPSYFKIVISNQVTHQSLLPCFILRQILDHVFQGESQEGLLEIFSFFFDFKIEI